MQTERQKVRAHYQCFSERFTKVGMTESALLKAYDSQLRRNPQLTAKTFLGLGRRR